MLLLNRPRNVIVFCVVFFFYIHAYINSCVFVVVCFLLRYNCFLHKYTVLVAVVLEGLYIDIGPGALPALSVV